MRRRIRGEGDGGRGALRRVKEASSEDLLCGSEGVLSFLGEHADIPEASSYGRRQLGLCHSLEGSIVGAGRFSHSKWLFGIIFGDNERKVAMKDKIYTKSVGGTHSISCL